MVGGCSLCLWISLSSLLLLQSCAPFESPDADLLVGSYSPEYQVVFRPFDLAVSEISYTFSGLPSASSSARGGWWLEILASEEVIEQLRSPGAAFDVTISDRSGTIVYASQNPLSDEYARFTYSSVRPPLSWCESEKGRVVRQGNGWRWHKDSDADEASGSDLWVRGVPGSRALLVATADLGSGWYEMTCSFVHPDSGTVNGSVLLSFTSGFRK